MRIFISLLPLTPQIILPIGLMGWVGWFLLLLLEIFLLRKWVGLNKSWGDHHKAKLIFLLLSIPITSLFFGVQIPAIKVGSSFTLGTENIIPLFFALPWMLTAGWFGPASAAIVGIISGFFGALWYSHDIYTPLEIALLAILYSAVVNQSHTKEYLKYLRIPLVSALGLIFILPFVYLYKFIFVDVLPFGNLDQLHSEAVLRYTITLAFPIVIGGLVSEIASILRPNIWGSNQQVIENKSKRSLQSRLLYYIIPTALILVTALLVTNWISAKRAAHQMIVNQMKFSAQSTLDDVSQFLIYGESIAKLIADQELLLAEDTLEIQKTLETSNKLFPFFENLSLYGPSGEPIVSHSSPENKISPNLGELRENVIAVANERTAHWIILHEFSGRTSAQLALLVPVFDENQNPSRVLIGWTDFNTNSNAQPILTDLGDSLDYGSTGMLIDEQGKYIYHPDPQSIMELYPGPAAFPEGFFEYSTPEDINELIYFRRAENHPWAVVISTPQNAVQELALKIATPTVVMTILIAIITILSLMFAGRILAVNLQDLTSIAGQISEGKLNVPLSVNRTDEIGQLSHSFEQMRSSLNDRLEELNRLLIVSQGVASSLNISTAAVPVLEAALSRGGSSARIVLKPDVFPEISGAPAEPIVFLQGTDDEELKELDQQILYFMGKQERLERLVLPDINRPRLFNLSPEKSQPRSILVVALRHENIFLGVLWVSYSDRHEFSEEEVRFFITLGGQAAIAAANARLYQQSEIGRQRMEAILSSSPDPILVTDQFNRLLLANPQAWQVLNLKLDANDNPPIEDIFQDEQIVELMRIETGEPRTLEIKIADGKIYLCTATSVIAKDLPVGRVCILRDITTFKELDALKSEFVSTVSHDLRTPLTLMRGYATMLEMVGDLNEQQNSYVQKIVSGVESMTRLVNNLLDLGRIEAGIALKIETISPIEIVNNVLSGLKLQAVQKRLELKSEIPEDIVPEIEADKALLQQALHNLVENAIKFTRGDGHVSVGVFTRGKHVRFKVTDDGIGISPMDKKHLFEKFQQLTDQSGDSHHGSGLGLAIVKSIAVRHGGQVWVDSQLGKGSTFYLEIPIHQNSGKTEK